MHGFLLELLPIKHINNIHLGLFLLIILLAVIIELIIHKLIDK